MDEKDVQKLKDQQEERIRDRHLSDIKQIVKSSQGRRLLWHVLSLCGVMDKSMCPSPYDTAFREGQRNIGMVLMSDIMTAQPEAYDQMRRENASNIKSDEAELNNKLAELRRQDYE